MSWIVANISLILQLGFTHLFLVIPPLLLAMIIALPLGYLANRHKVFHGSVVRTTQLLYAIPALALLVIIPGLLGISVTSSLNVMVALAIYALALLTQSSIDAFASLDRATLSAAQALGFSRLGAFFRVEMPLATPVFLAGLRVAAMSTVALTSIGALVGVPSLGSLLTDGFQRGLVAEIVSGIVAIVALALLCDGVIVAASRVLLPWMNQGSGGENVR